MVRSSTGPPPPGHVPPPRNKGLIAGLIKGNHWLISPDNKAGYFWGVHVARRGARLTIAMNKSDSPPFWAGQDQIRTGRSGALDLVECCGHVFTDSDGFMATHYEQSLFVEYFSNQLKTNLRTCLLQTIQQANP